MSERELTKVRPDKEKARQKAQLLKRLREERKTSVTHARALMKEQNAIRKQIRQALKGGPKTVPQVAEATGLPSEKVLWHIVALKKYNLVVEGEMDEEYYTYQLAEEAEK